MRTLSPADARIVAPVGLPPLHPPGCGAVIYLNPDQMSAAAGYINRQYGSYGYHVTAIESPTFAVSLFRVACGVDSSRFTVAVDKWGNCRDCESTVGENDRIAAMHAQAVAA
jgi:hypothetical protein